MIINEIEIFFLSIYMVVVFFPKKIIWQPLLGHKYWSFGPKCLIKGVISLVGFFA